MFNCPGGRCQPPADRLAVPFQKVGVLQQGLPITKTTNACSQTRCLLNASSSTDVLRYLPTTKQHLQQHPDTQPTQKNGAFQPLTTPQTPSQKCARITKCCTACTLHASNTLPPIHPAQINPGHATLLLYRAALQVWHVPQAP